MLECNPFPVLYIADASEQWHNTSFPESFKISATLKLYHLAFQTHCIIKNGVVEDLFGFAESSQFQFIIKTFLFPFLYFFFSLYLFIYLFLHLSSFHWAALQWEGFSSIIIQSEQRKCTLWKSCKYMQIAGGKKKSSVCGKIGVCLSKEECQRLYMQHMLDNLP